MKKSERNDENFNPIKVLYKGKVYETGNRYHDQIELYRDDKFVETVRMCKVHPIKDEIISINRKKPVPRWTTTR